MTQDCGCQKPASDRYVSFTDIDCDGRAKQIMDYIDAHIIIPERNDAFWEYFTKKRLGGSGPKPDDLFLIHSNLNQVRELFEKWDDNDALKLLFQLEEECC